VKPERLATLLEWGISFDTETHRVQPGLKAPPLVCGSLAQWSPTERRINGLLVDKEGALEAFLKLLNDERVVIVGQNVAYDMLVMAVYAARTRGLDLMPQIFGAYRAGRVFDVGIAEQLHAIARGTLRMDPRTGADLVDPITQDRQVGYRLSVLVDLVLNRIDAKINDVWRESYALLEPYPLTWWPLEARQYPVDDACNTLQVALAQAGHLPSLSVHEWYGGQCRRCGSAYAELAHRRDSDVILCGATAPRLNLHNLSEQCFADWAMHLGAAWGFVVDADELMKLEKTTLLVDEFGNLTARGKEMQRFVEAGILRPDGSEDQAVLKRLVALAYGCTGHHAACGGSGKVVTAWRKTNPNCPHGVELKARGLKTGQCPVCPPLAASTKNCVDCSATGLDLKSAPVPMTEPSDKFPNGQVQTGRDPLAESGAELLMDYGHFTEDRKIGGTYIPWLREGFDENGRQIPLTLWPNVLLETGRTSYGKVVQLLPRKGGVRECIVARPGKVLSTVDYEAGELITHAQSCISLGFRSALAQALLNGVKPHNALAATILSISYDEFQRRFDAKDQQAKDTRQATKPANFGFPGRMGPVKLVQQQRKQGPDTPHPSGPTEIELDDGTKVRGYKGLRFCLLMNPRVKACGEVKVTEWNNRQISPTCRECIVSATSLRQGWLKQWPENNGYFEHIKQLDESGGLVTQHVSKRLRTPSPKEGGVGNSLANGYFQGLLADAAKAALCQISFECYVQSTCFESDSQFYGKPSPLYGSRVIVFQHDEVITEHDAAIAHEAATRVSEIMVRWLRHYCPDLAPAVRAEPALMTRWYKGASPVIHGDRLVPWTPSHNPKKCDECAAQKQRDDARKRAAA
jgi:hypothetical protein